MKNILLVLLLATSASAKAGQITIPNSGETVSGDTKVCFYSNSNYDFTYEVSVNRQCPYTKTFSTDEDDEQEGNIGYILIEPEDLHKYIDENTTLVIDYDQIAFQAASALEKRSIKVIHKSSGNTKEFDKRTDFWGSSKTTIGGWLGALNSSREKAGKKTFSKEDFDIEDVQVAPDNIAFTFQAAKTKIGGILDHLKVTKYRGVIGVGKTFRHLFQMPTEYKSERSEIKPLQLSETKNYLVEQHNGDVVTDIEADDELEKYGYTGYQDYLKTGKFSYIVCSIDKDSLSTPSLLFNFYKEDGVFKTPQIILIDDSIGDIWVVEKSKKKEVKGWGSYWLAYQMLMGDKTDSIRPYQDFDIKFGDMTCYKLISQCKTQAELFQTVKDQYYEWFPTGVTFTSFDGVDVYLTTDEWLETIFQLVYMKRWDKDETTFESMLRSYISEEEEV